MKKRAVFSTVASIALAGAMCVGFAACGGETAESIKGEEVDKATWDAAFSEDSIGNVKAEMEITSVNTYETFSYEAEQKIVASFVGENQYIKLEGSGKVKGDLPAEMQGHLVENEIKLDYYYDGENSEYIDEVDGNWAYVTASAETPYIDALELVADMIPLTDYEEYEYSADKNGYVLKEEEQSPVIKFKDGKLKAVYLVNTREQGSVKNMMTISAIFTFSGQEVTLPTVA